MNVVWVYAPQGMVTVLTSAELDKGTESFSDILAPQGRLPPPDRVIMRMMINRGNRVPNN
jgi:hypothetical protein